MHEISPVRDPEIELNEFFSAGGSIELVSGCMFSGKTEELIKRLKIVKTSLDIHINQNRLTPDVAAEVLKAFKPRLDIRYSTEFLDSHSKLQWPAIIIDEKNPREIFQHISKFTKVVAIDEAQFFNKELIVVCEELAARSIRVIVGGLDTNFRGETFGLMGDLWAIADTKDQTTALCNVCGKRATKTQRIIIKKDEKGNEIERRPANYDDPLILVGAKNDYEARCRIHHEVPRRPGK